MARLNLQGVCALLLVGSFGFAQDADPVGQALALQKTTQKAIAAAEPSIACILVSRSDSYRHFGQPPPGPEGTGKLGGFEPQLVRPPQGLSEEDKKDLIRKLDLADPQHVPEAFGSGVVIDPAGLVLTNYHVVRDATKVFVRLPGNKTSYADIHAADPRSDLAVLRLLNPGVLPLPAVSLGDASKLERGQFVLSLANPFAAGFRDGQPSASFGIVSNLRRRILSGPTREEERVKPLYHYGLLLQTDVRLNVGCSGGALLNLRGELIGITTAFAAIQGGETPGGFALPLDQGMNRVLAALKRGEEVDYGFLGVGFKEKNDPNPGVTIQFVTPGSPAEMEARLRVHDSILAVDGIPVEESDDLFLHLGTHLAGSKVKLKVRRSGSRDATTVTVTLAKFYVPGKKIASSTGQRPFFRGVRVDYSSLVAQQAPGMGRIPTGVLVTEVQPGSIAEQAKLRPGEIVTHVNEQPVTSPAGFYQVVGRITGPAEFSLYHFGPQDPAPKVVLK
ncbi:MAG: PDZ domain-containing protein [Gemmataceae bacterium]|nr:PDZ domain-containing protein [Gemmataceae bacterium]MCI0737555.1 PDZ domain-containing protein [Gemmataceae bacterium]